MSGHTLFELPSREVRLKEVTRLWKATNIGGYLILAENGTQSGHQLIQEAKEHILKVQTNACQLIWFVFGWDALISFLQSDWCDLL